MPRQRSLIWNHFRRHQRGRYIYGDCNYCKKRFISNAKRMQLHIKSCTKAPKELRAGFENMPNVVNIEI
jgi:hypothetical protein